MPKQCPNCKKKRCSYGYEGSPPVICSDCVTDDKMINLYVNKCQKRGCTVAASFGIKGTFNRVHCKLHAKDNEELLTNHMCEKCHVITATYGPIKSKKSLHCSKCRESNEKRLIANRYCACGKIAYYRLKYTVGQPAKLKQATHCATCMDATTMESTIHNTCIVMNCTKKRAFTIGISNDFCTMHTLDRPTLLCILPNCNKLIISDYDACITHRTGRYNILTKHCEYTSTSLKDSLKAYLNL
jgi:hypothetical protein